MSRILIKRTNKQSLNNASKDAFGQSKMLDLHISCSSARRPGERSACDEKQRKTLSSDLEMHLRNGQCVPMMGRSGLHLDSCTSGAECVVAE